ncbi:NAD(P)H:quinone oxidoreductase [Tissierella pigra]|uniref:NAD(P)H:quinone oxidoreductase n=1 Tax=Tissierella pigra TaxID=2607614 RepID=A0A6N7XZW4_9FIRM|nr:NAD(P)H:quinone oxidoreductase [Tissierella pigra]MBU5428104.1 NAD(P)H:quinone oxidoreductase [Tissierella pigra]MSU02015.1 NAD(P)H:quinone oxidoreductase [Tissierella pigra]
MEKVKLAVIYYSSTGINYKLAKMAEEGALEVGAEVRVLKVQELAPDAAIDSNPAWRANVEATKDVPIATSADLDWADAIIFSMPTRFGNLPSQMKQFLDMQGGMWAQGKLTNKVVSAMASAGNPNGGQEVTVKSLYTSMMHWGAIIVPPGFTDDSIYKAGGNPYGTSVTQGQDGNMVEDVNDAVKHQAKRTVEVASWIKKGK